MPEQQARAARPQAAVEQGVLEIVRLLARETGGVRAERAVRPQASQGPRGVLLPGYSLPSLLI